MPHLMSGLFLIIYLFCVFFLFVVFFGESILVDYFFWLGSFEVSFSFVFDYLSMGFLSCVMSISCVVSLYSIFYMEGSIDYRRFYWLVMLFVASMLLLVFSGNFIMVMVGWDGLGLTSFCLVIFYANSTSLDSGLVTVFSNRVGDVFFLLSFFFFYIAGGFWFDISSYVTLNIFMILIFLGAITKSAQIPFSSWLPAAMAAPTPVSSLVHSSTLVTAGVYVLIRFNYVFHLLGASVLKSVSILTMILGGVVALSEKDIKKVVAMSTLSQLGLMLFVISSGAWVLSFIHMCIHAFFKSLLFLSTGSLMFNLSGNQDSRLYGSFSVSHISLLFFFLCSLCLAGFPFYIGFYSKDFIINSSGLIVGELYYFLFLVGCVLTVCYSVRLLALVYGGFLKGFSFSSNEESVYFYLFSFLLFFSNTLVGGFFYWLFLSDYSFSFCVMDLLTGIFVLVIGMVAYSFLKWSLFVLMFLAGFFGLRFLSSSGTSFLSKEVSFQSLESKWLEIAGGRGVYSFLFGMSKVVSVFEGLSVFFVFICFGGFYYLYFCP